MLIMAKKYPESAAWFERQFELWSRSRNRSDQTVSAFAEWLGIDREIVSHWINGIRRPSRSNALKICSVLGDDTLLDILRYKRQDKLLDRLISAYDQVPVGQREEYVERILDLFSEPLDALNGE